MERRLSRRACIAGAGVAVAGIAAGVAFNDATLRRLLPTLDESDVAALLADQESAVDFAQLCANAERFRCAPERPAFTELEGCWSRSMLRDRLRAAIQKDYAEGRCGEIDGWLVSHTEARIFSLAALLD